MKKYKEDFVVFKDEAGELFAGQNAEKNYKELKLSVRRPSHQERQVADFEYNKQMNKLLKEGIMPKMKLYEVMREKGIWDKEMESKETRLIDNINKCRDKLRMGKIKESEAVKLAKQGIKDNFELLQLTSQKTGILQNSAESISEDYRFNYLVSQCTVYNDDIGNHYFKDYDDFLRQDNAGNPVPYMAGMYFSRLINNFEDDFRKEWPEYKFLLKYKYVNDKLQFVNKQGQLVDEDGKLLEVQEQEKQEDSAQEPEFYPDDVSEEVEN